MFKFPHLKVGKETTVMTYFHGQVKLISQNKTELSSVPTLRSGQETVMCSRGHCASLFCNQYTVSEQRGTFQEKQISFLFCLYVYMERGVCVKTLKLNGA